jgi:hypothetical protein
VQEKHCKGYLKSGQCQVREYFYEAGNDQTPTAGFAVGAAAAV